MEIWGWVPSVIGQMGHSLNGGLQSQSGLSTDLAAVEYHLFCCQNSHFLLLFCNHGWGIAKLALEGLHAQGRVPEGVMGIFHLD